MSSNKIRLYIDKRFDRITFMSVDALISLLSELLHMRFGLASSTKKRKNKPPILTQIIGITCNFLTLIKKSVTSNRLNIYISQSCKAHELVCLWLSKWPKSVFAVLTNIFAIALFCQISNIFISQCGIYPIALFCAQYQFVKLKRFILILHWLAECHVVRILVKTEIYKQKLHFDMKIINDSYIW